MKNILSYKSTLFIIIVCLILQGIGSQELPRNGKRLNLDIGSLVFSATSASDITFSALKDYFIEIRREYVLKGKQRSYGRDTLDYFGVYQGYILYTDNILFFDNNATSPWQTDSSFVFFSDTLTPLARPPAFRKMNDSAWKEQRDFASQAKLYSGSNALNTTRGYRLKHLQYPDSVRVIVFSMQTDSGTNRNIPIHRIRYEKVSWNTDGQASLTDITDGSQFIGGAVFSEVLQKGIVEWCPVGWIDKTTKGLVAFNMWGKTTPITKNTPPMKTIIDSIPNKTVPKLNDVSNSKEKKKRNNMPPAAPKTNAVTPVIPQQ